jgi:methyltransferase (TIGR00027 family)
MRQSRYVASAQQIAFVRAHLTKTGVLDDPFASHFLHPGDQVIPRALMLLEKTGLWRNRPFAYLAARTRFYDATVARALKSGIRQVIILGAGYDSRAWRLAHEGVAYFEVDLPEVQSHKIERAPAGGPIYVSADLATDAAGELLLAAGFVASVPSVILCEGLAIDFATGAEHSQRIWRVLARANRTCYSLKGMPLRLELHPSQAPPFLADCGWTTTGVLTGREMHAKFLNKTDLPVPRSIPGAYVVSAVRQ